jgi:hypothetical protein
MIGPTIASELLQWQENFRLVFFLFLKGGYLGFGFLGVFYFSPEWFHL